MSPHEIERFQAFIIWWYRYNGRKQLPWRLTTDPYKILVSELMLQQTQVERVIPRYTQFLEVFPTTESLASATLADVLKQWQGLGYNRRAKFLHLAAREVTAKHSGVFPQTTQELELLPGIGPYTASAIVCFAFNQPAVLIETNVRTVYLYHFFPEEQDVSDKAILELVSQTLWQQNPRLWYSALMDYGSVLKKLHTNPSRKSKQYSKQTPFAGSLRQARGEIIRTLTQRGALTRAALSTLLVSDPKHHHKALADLAQEHILVVEGNTIRLA